MAEELVLTDPVVVPAKTTAKYHVVDLSLQFEFVTTPAAGPGLIVIGLRDNNGEASTYRYVGAEAISFMKFMNTANFTVNSMQKRILQKLSNDGFLPGTVQGTPDP